MNWCKIPHSRLNVIQMVDGVRLSIRDEVLKQNLEQGRYLENKTKKLIERTGEIQTAGTYKGLRFTVFSSGRIEIIGSLHKFFNDGQHNYNDFYLSDIKQVLNELAAKFGSEILNCKIDSIEFGLNINTHDTAADFIKRRNIILIKSGPKLKNPILSNDLKGFDKGIKYILSECWLKIYNKGVQCNVSDKLLRCEYKAVKMRVLKDDEIFTLADVANSQKLERLFNKLIDLYNGILIREDLNKSAMSERDKKLIDRVFNPDWWNDRIEVCPVTRMRKKEQFQKVYEQYATSRIKEAIREKLIQKFHQLVNA